MNDDALLYSSLVRVLCDPYVDQTFAFTIGFY